MSKLRSIVVGSAGLLAIGAGLMAVPSSRHFIRHEVAKHRPFRFGATTATAVVPVEADVPAAVPSEADPRFSPNPTADKAPAHLVPAMLEVSAFDPPTATTITPKGAPQSTAPIEKIADGPAAAKGDAELSVDLAGARQAIAFYRTGNLAAADDFARMTSGPLRTLLDWAAIRLDSHEVGMARMQAFGETHAGWPALPWINRRIEEAKANNKDPNAVLGLFAQSRPQTLYGRLALAKARIATGDPVAGAQLVHTIWREDDLTIGEESAILKEFGTVLRKEDHKARADRLLYKEDVPAALRAAALAGPDVVLLERARIAVIQSAPSDAAIAAVPKPLQNDPGLIFARIQKARRAGKIADAAALMSAAPTDPAALINGDEWWVERRLIARKLLDMGNAKAAYTLCAGHSATSVQSRIEAEFHAGWIALRFLNDPALAAPHFAADAAIAETPISVSRSAYWQARTAEAAGNPAAASTYYAAAADQPTTFYGQLAAAQIGRTSIALREPAPATSGPPREAIRVVALLFALGERELAMSLAVSMAKTDPDPAQVAALAKTVADTEDARATLVIGKAASQRGIAIDAAAFPTFGIPGYQPLGNSADRPTVFAIARQESEFDPRSVSSAGAKGLMQLISSTARRTAELAGVDFNETRLLSDAAFNAQIGAAHLGKLLSDEGGSYILTFAAYNAGSKRVQEWIAAYGDPRRPGVDPIDWIERIPFTETRNYVQRVFENMQIYRVRFGMPTALLVDPRKQMQAGKGT